MTDYDYDALLDRARERIPKDIRDRSRWTMPEPDILIEGSQTILRNFADIISAMDRDSNHVYQFLLNELGTSGTREQIRVMFKGRVRRRGSRRNWSLTSRRSSCATSARRPTPASSRRGARPC